MLRDLVVAKTCSLAAQDFNIVIFTKRRGCALITTPCLDDIAGKYQTISYFGTKSLYQATHSKIKKAKMLYMATLRQSKDSYAIYGNPLPGDKKREKGRKKEKEHRYERD